MEGTRHEKVAIVAAAYIIGFTTAFILFGNFQASESEEVFISPADVNPAAVVTAVAQEIEPVPVAEVVAPLGVTYNSGLLEMTLSDGAHLLSFNPEISDIAVDISEMKQGFHYGDIKYRVSESGDQVFFCEQQDKEVDSCLGFIYDANSDRIHQITKDGVPVNISPKTASEVIWTAVGLKVGTHYSADVSKPWVLVQKEGAIDLQ